MKENYTTQRDVTKNAGHPKEPDQLRRDSNADELTRSLGIGVFWTKGDVSKAGVNMKGLGPAAGQRLTFWVARFDCPNHGGVGGFCGRPKMARTANREPRTANGESDLSIHQCLTNADIEILLKSFNGDLTHPPASPMSQIRHQGGDRQWA